MEGQTERQRDRQTQNQRLRLDSIKQTNGAILLNKHSGRQINKVRNRQTDRRAKKQVVRAKMRVKEIKSEQVRRPCA